MQATITLTAADGHTPPAYHTTPDGRPRGQLVVLHEFFGLNDHIRSVADRFAAKHRERVGVLERKLAAQREELALAQRELDEMRTQLKTAAAAQPSTEQTWRDLEEAGGAREGTDLRDELLKSDMDRAAREAAAARQLEELKKKMRKD